MATALTDPYLQQIHVARTHINTRFRRAHELLTVRETNLLRELEDMQSKYEKHIQSHQEELQGLEVSKQTLKNNLRNNDALNEALALINRQIEQILNLSSGTQTIRFQWNADFERELEHAGDIITSTITQPVTISPSIPSYKNKYIPVIPDYKDKFIPDYKDKSIPALTCCMHNDNPSGVPGIFCYPNGLSIEPQTELIYIADSHNNRVQVFTASGECCFMFNEKMNYPMSICIGNGIVYVSQFCSHCINLYNLDGAYIKTAGSLGSRKEQFNYPTGIAVSESTGYLYVCDSFNHRLQVFNHHLHFHSTIGDTIIYQPRDVKLSPDLVIVLDEMDPCVHLFNYTDHSLISNIISRGNGKQINHSLFFTIDRECNIILTDKSSHHVKVFSKAGDFIAQFGKQGHAKGDFIEPAGVAIDSQNRIVVASRNTNNALQIF